MNRIELIPQPSKLLFSILLVIHGLAILAICFSGVYLLVKIIIFILLPISFYHLIALQQGSKSIVRCIYSDDCWILFEGEGEERRAKLLGDTLVTQALVILNFRVVDSRKQVSLVLMSDSLDKETFRRLRVELLGHRVQ